MSSIDWAILNWVHDTLKCGFLDFVMPLITMLGNGGMIWVVTAIFMLLTKKYRRTGIILLVGLLAGLLIGNVIIKNLVERPRPCWINQDVVMLVPVPRDYSFPSGHTLSSTIGATVLTKSNRKFGLIAIPLAVLIALSRLYLYVHFPSDVLFGAVLGIVIGLGVYDVLTKIFVKYTKNY